ncbi:hypothetical protein [Bradyrhizobium sp. sGM-13]|uniref:hypothetical protein n=1 Tax=Bradyrhizobium sp. sGM-13 TaxID=2831781 RepID=UPI0035C87EA5
MPFEGGTFDRALALLVLHFVGQGSRRDASRRSVGRCGRGDRLGPPRRHARHAHDGRLCGGVQRSGAPAACSLLLPTDDAAGRNETDFPRTGSCGRNGNAADDPHGLPQLRRLLGTDCRRRRTAG